MMKRIESIDVMRGISIMGILFMNIVGFHMNELYTHPIDHFHTSMDRFLYYLDVLFVHNSFYPIFSFLFGFGLAIMAANIKERGGNFLPILYRRVFALLIFGMLHGLFIFYGDILNVYAVLGMIAIIFLLLPNIVSLITATVISVLYLLINLILMVAAIVEPQMLQFTSSEESKHWIDVMHSGDIGKIITLNQQFFLENFSALSVTGIFSYGLSVLPFILFGMFTMRANLIDRINLNKKVSITIAFISFIIGLLIKYYTIYADLNMFSGQAFIFYGGTFVAISYFIATVLVCNYKPIYTYLKPFQRAGKMSFTLYITQSVIMFIIFYVFKLYAMLSLVEVYMIAVIIIILELVFATLYFKRFKYGPLEWIWRKITYLK